MPSARSVWLFLRRRQMALPFYLRMSFGCGLLPYESSNHSLPFQSGFLPGFLPAMQFRFLPSLFQNGKGSLLLFSRIVYRSHVPASGIPLRFLYEVLLVSSGSAAIHSVQTDSGASQWYPALRPIRPEFSVRSHPRMTEVHKSQIPDPIPERFFPEFHRLSESNSRTDTDSGSVPVPQG